jgi:hypothetical protein
MRKFAFVIAAIVSSAFPLDRAAHAQSAYVIDTAFCKGIDGKECREPISSRETVDISELEQDPKGNPVIYFWGGLRNRAEVIVKIAFLRTGECYRERPSLPKEKFLQRRGVWKDMLAKANSLSAADLVARAGFKDVSLQASKVVDLKINIVPASASDKFRTFSFRNVMCPGTFQARLMDSHGNPIAPDEYNDVKTVTFTDVNRSGAGPKVSEIRSR